MLSMKVLTETNKKKLLLNVLKILAVSSIVILFFAAIIYIGAKMGNLLGVVVISAIIAYLLLPVQKLLEKRLPKWFAAIVVVLIAYGSIIAILSFLVPMIFKQLSSVTSQISYITDWINNITTKIQSKINDMNIPISLQDVLGGSITKLMGYLSDMTNSLIEHVISFFQKIPVITLIPILTFYFLKDRSFFAKYLVFLIPVKWRTPLGKIYCGADKVIKSYVRTQFIVAVIVGVATMIGYFIIGMPYAFLLGVLMGICEIIPYFGPILGAIPACIVVLIWDPSKIIWTIIAVIAVQQLEGNFLSPYLMGAHFDINPITVIAVLWISGNLLGFAGFIFAIPIYVIVKDVGKVVFNKLVKAG